MTTIPTNAAVQAAAAKRKEEEEMTPYTPEELAEGWEFKILRSNTSAFKRPEVFETVCAEEAEAGWILVEKFDNARIRFKRPAAAKRNDHKLDFDPYRTVYGISAERMGLLIVLGIFGSLGLVAGIVFLVKSYGG